MVLRVSLVAVVLALLCTVAALHQHLARERGTHTIRSSAARRAFRKRYPCPATGSSRGPCPGFVIDHMKPLACGGADAPENMQWQTTAEAKAKDAVERRDCGN